MFALVSAIGVLLTAAALPQFQPTEPLTIIQHLDSNSSSTDSSFEQNELQYTFEDQQDEVESEIGRSEVRETLEHDAEFNNLINYEDNNNSDNNNNNLIRQEISHHSDGSMVYGYETAGADAQSQDVEVLTRHIGEAVGVVMRGSYTFIAKDDRGEDREYTVDWVADERGFRPVGDHLPRLPEEVRQEVPEQTVKQTETAQDRSLDASNDNGGSIRDQDHVSISTTSQMDLSENLLDDHMAEDQILLGN